MCMKYLRLIGIIILFSVSRIVLSQELNCIITINADQVSETDKRVYETMRTAITEFMNSRKWTNYNYEISERIECNILITIKERSGDDFEGQIQVQSRRPIFKTSYNSTLLNIVDKDLKFKYTETDALEFNEGQITQSLTAVLAYYAYIIIGYDFDSFSLYGGTPFFDKAQTIVNQAQSRGEAGWKAFESTRNRYWLLENLYNKTYTPLREAMYNFHRLGLDNMYDNQSNARQNITSAIEKMQKVYREKTGIYLLQLILTAKADEIVNIYSAASTMEKTKIIEIMKDIDASNSDKYNKIMKPE